MHPTESQKVPRSFKAWWKMLGRSIYEGDRLKANLKQLQRSAFSVPRLASDF